MLLALILAQYTQPRIFDQPNLRSGNASAVAPTYFEFAPASGAGLPVAEPLCDALEAEVPSWSAVVDGGAGNWCMRGDLTMQAGGAIAMASDAGVDTLPVLPSGPDGATVSALRMTTGIVAASTAATASGTGAFTACWLGVPHDTAQFFALSQMSADSVGGHGWRIERLSGSQWRFVGSNGSALTILTPTGGPNNGEHGLVCMTQGAGSSTLKPYFNEVAGTASAAFVRNATTAKFSLHGINGASDGTAGGSSVRGAFYLDQELSAAQIAAISHRVLADQPKALVRGVESLAMTYTRTGSMFCSKADNTGSIIPASRPCIASGGVLAEGPATNLTLRSQELNSATWTPFSVGVGIAAVTANYGAAPDGTMTAERLQVAACPANGDRSAVSQVFASTSAAYTGSLYLKGVSGSGSIGHVQYSSAESAGVYSECAYTSTAWTRCSVTKTYASITGGIGLGCYRYTPFIPGSHDTGAADVLVWGHQTETGTVPTSYIPTTTAAVARGAAMPYFVDTTGTVNPALFSAAMTVNIISQPGQYSSILRLAGASYQADTGGRGVWLYSASTTGSTHKALSLNNSAGPGANGSAISTPVSPFRVVGYNDGAFLNFSMGSTVATPAAFTPGAFEAVKYIDLGNQQGSSTLDAVGGVISGVCLDPRPSRCR